MPTQSSDATVHSALPLARVKRIVRLDDDIIQCSNSSAFAIAVATEMFIQYFAEQAHNVVRSERKPRKNIQYRDLATAVARIDNLEFLADVVPKVPPTQRPAKEKRIERAHGEPKNKGQRPLLGHRMTDQELQEDGRDGEDEIRHEELSKGNEISRPEPPGADQPLVTNEPSRDSEDIDMTNS